jgi:hypothetical protein
VDGQPVVSGLLDIAGLDCKDEIQSTDGAARGNTNKADHSRVIVDDFVSCMRGRGYVQNGRRLSACVNRKRHKPDAVAAPARMLNRRALAAAAGAVGALREKLLAVRVLPERSRGAR